MARAPLTFIILQRVHEAEIWWLLRWKLHLIKNPIGKSQLDTIKRIPFQTSLFVFGNVHEGIYHVLCMLYNIYNVWYIIYNERFSEWVSRKVISYFLIKIKNTTSFFLYDEDMLLCIWAERDKLVSQWWGRLFLNCCEKIIFLVNIFWKDYYSRLHFLEKIIILINIFTGPRCPWGPVYGSRCL